MHAIFHVISWNMDFDGSITTHSGVRFWPLLPNPDDILIEDIAHSLSLQCRFAGHSRVFYSVAEHSVRVSQLSDRRMHYGVCCMMPARLSFAMSPHR